MNITITKKAEAMLNTKLASGEFLRIFVKEGGCAGLTYGAAIANEMQPDESVVHTAGAIRIVADAASVQFIDGLVIDYSDELINGGLQFTNSNTKTTCGCGQSFTLQGFPKLEGSQAQNLNRSGATPAPQARFRGGIISPAAIAGRNQDEIRPQTRRRLARRVRGDCRSAPSPA
ncbi:MAG: HesB/IscA family protein [Desulfurivibrionaceae bacterium]